MTPMVEDERRTWWSSPWLRLAALALLVAGLVGLLWPTLTAPLTADERYQYLWVPSTLDGSWAELVPFTWEEISRRVDGGRIVPFGYLVQRVAYLGGTGIATVTGTSILVSHAVVKLIMLALGVWTAYALLGRIRLRLRGDETSRHLSPVTVRVATLLFTVLLVAGVQTHQPGRGAWTTYPVLAWGAVAVCLGTTWALLRLTDAVAENARWWFLAAPVLLFLALFLNTSYEMYYVAVPLALLALLVHAPPGATARERWRPKILTAAVFGGAFLVVFVAIRRHIAAICAVEDCYVGAVPRLGLKALETGFLNLVSAVPGFGRTEALARIEAVEAPPAGLAGPFEGWGWMAALVVVVATLVLLRSLTGSRSWRVEGREVPVLWVLVGLGVAMAGSTALVMGLSVQAQDDVVSSIGTPYRNTVVTWAGIALALVAASLVVARAARWAAVAPAVLVTAAVLWAGAVIWPINTQVIDVTRAQRANLAIASLYDQVTMPDLEDEERRCEILEAARERLQFDTGRTIVEVAQKSFQIYWDRPFCSTAPDPE
jgi:hypothetical protein